MKIEKFKQIQNDKKAFLAEIIKEYEANVSEKERLTDFMSALKYNLESNMLFDTFKEFLVDVYAQLAGAYFCKSMETEGYDEDTLWKELTGDFAEAPGIFIREVFDRELKLPIIEKKVDEFMKKHSYVILKYIQNSVIFNNK